MRSCYTVLRKVTIQSTWAFIKYFLLNFPLYISLTLHYIQAVKLKSVSSVFQRLVKQAELNVLENKTLSYSHTWYGQVSAFDTPSKYIYPMNKHIEMDYITFFSFLLISLQNIQKKTQ